MVALVAVTVVVVLLRSGGSDPAGPVAQSYLTAWNRRDFAAMASLVEHPPPNFAAIHQAMFDDLGVANWQYRLGSVTSHAGTADAGYSAHLVLGGIGAWDYSGSMHLAKVFGHWLVEWTPATMYRALTPGAKLTFQRTFPPRAAVLGAGGTVLAGPTDVVTVGLEGDAVTSVAEVTTALTQAGIDANAIAAALKAATAHPKQFTPVADLADARYQQVKPIIFRVPGTRFQRHTGQASVTADLGAHVVGSLGAITAQQLQQLGLPYRASDSVGQTGIEAQYERQLAGTPGGSIQVIGANGTVLATPATFTAKPGTAVHTSLDLHTQQVAEAALNGLKQPAALVAIRASTGEVLAAVSRPDSTPFDRSLQGQYPPGSTFKVITSAALLASGLTPDSPTTCPKTLTVDGRAFKNFEGESSLDISFLRAFAVSCNTAFITLAGKLTGAQLISAAGQFGFGTNLQPGVPVFGGQIPPPVDDVEKVASAIGQARVLASPLQMAAVAAAVDSGSYHAPRLVVGAPDDTAKAIALAPPVVAGLHTMMAAVVSSGTGTPANVGGSPPVYGKTGTAEFGNATPPMTHAWFIGFRGDVAFAIVVEGGGVGGTVAGPIAAKFLRGL
ncbi:MAG TPA: penicillin-binding transpeptidase domain-containing protein [Acidimicrobiales bacterium]|nr:penicillin-binding transpeptidase domain-containing protein [Acidimicrobiales bacterium]